VVDNPIVTERMAATKHIRLSKRGPVLKQHRHLQLKAHRLRYVV
jgi:hypothetical protein